MENWNVKNILEEILKTWEILKKSDLLKYLNKVKLTLFSMQVCEFWWTKFFNYNQEK